MTRLHHQLHTIRPRRGTAVVLLILACLAAALGASAANAQSPNDETTAPELCPGLQPLTMIVNLQTLRDGRSLTKTTTSTRGDCSVSVTLSEAEHANALPSAPSDSICTVTARPVTSGRSVEIQRELQGPCNRVAIQTSITMPSDLNPPSGAAGSSSATGTRSAGEVRAEWRGFERLQPLRLFGWGSIFYHDTALTYAVSDGEFLIWDVYDQAPTSDPSWIKVSESISTGIRPGVSRSATSSYRWRSFIHSAHTLARVVVTNRGVAKCEFNDARFTGGTTLSRLPYQLVCRCEVPR